MIELTERQAQILKILIEEYIETAQPVGSETLDKKYNLGISPATIRNEMVKLTKMGFLNQPHTSAGRTPTPTALKYYIRELMEPKKLGVTEEIAVKEKVWDKRNQFDEFLKEATKTLANQTKTLALSATQAGDFYWSGVANILNMPEFYDINLTRNVLSLLDEFDYWQKLLEKMIGEDPLHILLGEDLGEVFFEPCGFIFSEFRTPTKQKGAIGVIGPCRMNYCYIIPVVRYFGDLISEATSNW